MQVRTTHAPLSAPTERSSTSLTARKPKLLDQLREALRSHHYSRRTEQTYCHWVKRFIYFLRVRHPAEMAEPEINVLTRLAVKEKVSTSIQNQTPSALLFLSRHVVGRKVGDLVRGPLARASPLAFCEMFLKLELGGSQNAECYD